MYGCSLIRGGGVFARITAHIAQVQLPPKRRERHLLGLNAGYGMVRLVFDGWWFAGDAG